MRPLLECFTDLFENVPKWTERLEGLTESVPRRQKDISQAIELHAAVRQGTLGSHQNLTKKKRSVHYDGSPQNHLAHIFCATNELRKQFAGALKTAEESGLTDVFKDIDDILSHAQDRCIEAAYEALRSGDCTEKVEAAQEQLHKARTYHNICGIQEAGAAAKARRRLFRAGDHRRHLVDLEANVDPHMVSENYSS